MTSFFHERIQAMEPRTSSFLWFWFESVMTSFTLLNRYRRDAFSQVNQILSGTLYVGATQSEVSPWYALDGKIQRLVALRAISNALSIISTQSTTHISLPNDSVDYIFTDPPFGSNIIYSDLNIIWEAWLNLFTNTDTETVVHRRKKNQPFTLQDYGVSMAMCFTNMYRVLKSGRWLTVEFHNSRNSVWNVIQETLQQAGFVIADVRTLDKKQGSFKQVTSGGAVKQDLVISAYKPTSALETSFKLEAGTEQGAWDFVRSHLRQLPVVVMAKDKGLEPVIERKGYLLFDRMVAFHVQRGVIVPLSAAEFYAGLEQRFPPRDGMYFLPDQVVEYDKKRMAFGEPVQLSLFVNDEASAIQWLRQQLTSRPQTFQQLHPQFMQDIAGWQRHEKSLELSDLLEQNFLRYDGKEPVPSQIHSYLSSEYHDLRNLGKDDPTLKAKAKGRWYVPDPNKAGDLEKLREKALLEEFEEYRGTSQKKLKVFRLEAVRAGFKRSWQQRDYATIIAVAHKIPEEVLQEDPKLLMWYDQALTRTSEEA